MSNVLITGGTGLIGRALVRHFADAGHQVTVISRSPKAQAAMKQVRYVSWPADMTQVNETFGAVDIIINLAGDPINKGRWTARKKQAIQDSRVHMTRKVIACIEHLSTKPKLLINASAIGYYRFSESERYTEQDVIEPQDFLGLVSAAWEQEARLAEGFGVRTVVARLGVVLARDGGALAPMVMPYKLFGGGTVGSGKQWLSWIHLADVVGLMQFIIDHESMHGAVNFTAPEPQQMKVFGQLIGKVLRRPHWLPVPSFALRLLFGEMGDLLLKGQHVTPQKALEHGYSFRYPTAEQALTDLLT